MFANFHEQDMYELKLIWAINRLVFKHGFSTYVLHHALKYGNQEAIAGKHYRGVELRVALLASIVIGMVWRNSQCDCGCKEIVVSDQVLQARIKNACNIVKDLRITDEEISEDYLLIAQKLATRIIKRNKYLSDCEFSAYFAFRYSAELHRKVCIDLERLNYIAINCYTNICWFFGNYDHPRIDEEYFLMDKDNHLLTGLTCQEVMARITSISL